MTWHFIFLYMDMEDFAEMRGADYGKLNKGLGLAAMATQTYTKTIAQTIEEMVSTHISVPALEETNCNLH